MRMRKARQGDEKGLANVIVTTWKNAYRDIVPADFLDALTTERHEQIFRQHIKDSLQSIFVMEDSEGKMIGMVSGGQDRKGVYDCELVAIYILPEHQKSGYGKQLFRTMVYDHSRHGYKSMIIWTFQENRDQMFYEKLGGIIKEKSAIEMGGREIPSVGYAWEDIGRIGFN